MIDWTKPVRCTHIAHYSIINPDIPPRLLGSFTDRCGVEHTVVVVSAVNGGEMLIHLDNAGVAFNGEVRIKNVVEDAVGYLVWGYRNSDDKKRVTIYDTYLDRTDAEYRVKMGSPTFTLVGITEARVPGAMIAAAVNSNP
jgi:hypothetical protein